MNKSKAVPKPTLVCRLKNIGSNYSFGNQK